MPAGRLQEGRLRQAEYQAVLEAEIARVVARQEDIGLPVVTDGELARSSWFGFFFEGLDGFRLEPSHFKFKDADGCAFEWPTCVASSRIRRRAPITLLSSSAPMPRAACAGEGDHAGAQRVPFLPSRQVGRPKRLPGRLRLF